MNKLKDKKIIAVLSYMWLLSFIPFLTTNDKFVKFHSKQGIRLTIIYTPIILILLLLNKINFLYKVTDILIPIILVIVMIYSFMGIIDVIKNRQKELPFINEIFNRRKYEKKS